MKVRFHMRSEVNGRIIDAGDVTDVPDDTLMYTHMENVETGKFGGLPMPGSVHVPLFLDHSGDAARDSAQSGYYNPALTEKRG